jgi:Flp pilus assembly protein TadD
MHSLLFLSLFALTVPAAARTNAVGQPSSALHGYVLGRAASSGDSLSDAARFFEFANAQDPGKATLVRRAFELAVASGDSSQAFALAHQLQTSSGANAELGVLLLSEAVLKKDWKAADAARLTLAGTGYAQVVSPIAEAWVGFGRGDTAAALALLDPQSFTGFARSYVAEQRAHMLAAARRWPEAAEAYASLRAGTAAGISFIRVGEADAVAEGGDKVRALALLDGNDPPTVAARSRLQAGKRIGALAPGPRQGIAWMAARLASDLSRERPVPLALLFARTATFLAPDVPAGWLIAGDVLARGGQRAAALEAYQKVGNDDALAGAARNRRAEVLEAMGETAGAGDLLRKAADAPGAGSDAWVRLGDWHRRAEAFGPAIEAYSQALNLTPEGSNNWGLWFLRGSMKEQARDWPGAEADLREALKLSPDEPVVLNYLGYSLLDRSLKLIEAGALIEKAAALRPADGGIIDSLGWSEFRRGKFADAVTTLEKAAELEPTDPTVNDHLGDAYWRVGRRIEANFRWRAALQMEPTDKQRRELLAKLDYGLDAALAMAN